MNDVYRRSALLLHSIGESDRAWVLQRLDAEQRADLSGYLQELIELGLPADPSLVDALFQQSEIVKPDIPLAPWHALRTASAQKMLHVLRAEPTWLIATILSIEAWPWNDAIVAGLDASRRDRVRLAMREAVSARLAASLCAELEARLAATHAEKGQPAAPASSSKGGFGSLLFERLRSWF